MKADIYVLVKDRFCLKLNDAVRSIDGIFYGPVFITYRKDLSGKTPLYRRKTYHYLNKEYSSAEELSKDFYYTVKAGELADAGFTPCYYPALKLYDQVDWIKLLKSKKIRLCGCHEGPECIFDPYDNCIPAVKLIEYFESTKSDISVTEVLDKVHKRDEELIKWKGRKDENSK